MKAVYLILLGALFFTSCSNADHNSTTTIVIEGSFSKSAGEKIYLMELSADDLSKIDSVIIGDDGSFLMEFTPLESPELYVIRSDHFKQAITLLINAGEHLQLSGDLPTLNEAYSVSGSDGSVRVYELTQIINSRMAKVSTYYNEYRDNPDSLDHNVLRVKVDSLLQINQVAVYDEIRSFIKESPSSLSSLLALYSQFGRNTILDYKFDADLFQMVSDSLIAKYPNSSHAIKLHQKVLEFENADQIKAEQEAALSVGKVFPEIALNDIDNKVKQLSNCKAKICLVALWKSTNKDSWEMNAKLRELYEKFHEKGLEIYEISFDTDKLAWANYCHMEKLVWTNVIGNLRIRGMLNAEDNLPRIFVLDSNRKILNKDPKVEELEQVIQAHLQ